MTERTYVASCYCLLLASIATITWIVKIYSTVFGLLDMLCKTKNGTSYLNRQILATILYPMSPHDMCLYASIFVRGVHKLVSDVATWNRSQTATKFPVPANNKLLFCADPLGSLTYETFIRHAQWGLGGREGIAADSYSCTHCLINLVCDLCSTDSYSACCHS